jgi:hypothetical protein
MHAHRLVAMLAIAGALPAAPALAQPLGTFRWQLQPYCNIVTVNVTQQGGIYTLDGTDDRCGGGGPPASLVGIAFLIPNGAGFGLTTVLPGGTPIHTEATINIASLGGTWRDSGGNNGTFVFTPGGGVAGAPRPIPSGGIAPASITNIQMANNAVTGANVVDASITSADISDGVRVAFVGGDNQNLDLTPAQAIVRSLTITAPAAGKIIVNASGFFEMLDALLIDYARCEITTAATLVNAATFHARERAAGSMEFVPFAATRGFNVAAGNHTFNLVCEEAGGEVRVWRTFMTATYAPQ